MKKMMLIAILGMAAGALTYWLAFMCGGVTASAEEMSSDGCDERRTLRIAPGFCLSDEEPGYGAFVPPASLPVSADEAAFAQRHLASTFMLTVFRTDGRGPAIGTAVAINKDGRMLTAAHAVDKAKLILATPIRWSDRGEDGSRFISGDPYVMRIVQSDIRVDVALLAPDGPMPAPAAAQPTERRIAKNERVYMLGAMSDVGSGHVITDNALIQFESGQASDVGALWLPGAPGDSGGPVFSPDGELLGLIRGGRGRVSFFTPYSTAREALRL